MLTAEQNETLTRVGPGTPMGSLMREYWVPAAASSELPEPGCDPVRVMLLGEKLIAFRDSSGKVGLVDSVCPHRGASLFFARNEECGLRCVYHGWKFDTSGTCVDQPSEPAGAEFMERVKLKAYPCVERGGIVWTYMGPRETPPPLPDLEANDLGQLDAEEGAGIAGLQVFMRPCNWLQALENELDTTHQVFLHFGASRPEDEPEGTMRRFAFEQRAVRYNLVDTEYGAMYGAHRPAGDGKLYWRYGLYLFPFYTMGPIGLLGKMIMARAWVPMDDHHVMLFGMSEYVPEIVEARKKFGGKFTEYLPNSTDWYGRFRMAANVSNDFYLDRSNPNYSGIEGITVQDQMITEGMGPVVDRSKEHLGSSDAMIVRVRRLLLRAVKDHAETGKTPPGVDNPELYRQRGGGVILREDEDWLEATEHLRDPDLVHDDLDESILGGLI